MIASTHCERDPNLLTREMVNAARRMHRTPRKPLFLSRNISAIERHTRLPKSLSLALCRLMNISRPSTKNHHVLLYPYTHRHARRLMLHRPGPPLTRGKMKYHTHRPIQVCLSSNVTSCDGSKIRILLASSALLPNASDSFQTTANKMVCSNNIYLSQMLTLY